MKRPRAKNIFAILKQAASDFGDDKASTLAAAVSFYAALSLAPMLMLLLSFSHFLGGDSQRQLVSELSDLLGPEIGRTVDMIIDSAKAEPGRGLVSRVVGFATLLFSASAVFAELQSAMNKIWDVEEVPYNGVVGFLRTRLLSMGLVVSLGFLLVVSMVASAALSATVDLLDGRVPGSAILWRLMDVGLSFAMYTAMFAAMYRVLPDVRIGWLSVVGGAAITAFLFVVGKTVVGLYLGTSSLASSYGAAGSLVVMLGWVYYSSLIVFFGAEVTQVWSARRGTAIQPLRTSSRSPSRAAPSP